MPDNSATRAEQPTVDAALRAAARDRGDAVFLRDGDRSVGFAQLDARVDAVAAGLADRGIGAGDRVAVAAVNSVAWIEVFFATVRLGAVLVTLNVRYREAELEYMLNQSGTRLLITDAAAGEFDFVAFYETFRPRIPQVSDIVFAHAPEGIDVDRYADLPRPASTTVFEPPEPDAPAVILYTSGTTGRPKGAVLTQASLLAAAAGQGERTGLGPDDVLLATMPFNHVGGITCTILAALLAGSGVVLQPSFSPTGSARALHEFGVTVFAGVPTMWKLLLDSLGEDETLPALRLGIVGGSNAEPALCRAIIAAAPQARLFNLYGLSESSGACVMSAPDDTVETIATTLGTPLAGVQARIADDAGNEVADGIDGRLEVRGACVAAGYWALPEATASTFLSDGWLSTGDMAVRHNSGHLQLRGRLKEMFIQGGYNIYPAEVENVLVEHPSVAAAAGLGVPDTVLGEIGHYFVTLAAGRPAPQPAELQGFCAERLADYKVPRRIEFVEDFPLTPAGKIAKATLRQRLAEVDS